MKDKAQTEPSQVRAANTGHSLSDLQRFFDRTACVTYVSHLQRVHHDPLLLHLTNDFSFKAYLKGFED